MSDIPNKNCKNKKKDGVNDALIMEIARMLELADSGTTVVNVEQAKKVKVMYEIMRNIVKGVGVKVTYVVNEPSPDMGCVKIDGKKVVITNPAMFSAVANYASNFEIYPMLDGSVHMGFTFHGLTKDVEV